MVFILIVILFGVPSFPQLKQSQKIIPRAIRTGKKSAYAVLQVSISNLNPSLATNKDVKSCIFSCNIKCAALKVLVRGISWPKTGATHFYAQLGLSEKGWLSATFEKVTSKWWECYDQ